jgi:DNA mismatch repair ATPase MutS
MFEREVEFAVEILKRAKQVPKQSGLILFDELFHSTNPPDGTRTASLFLHNVWKQSNLISIISTHVFTLAKEAPESVMRLCVPAEVKEKGELVFSYTLQKGICEVSSVDCILKEKGLLPAEFNAPENRKAKER